MMSEFATSRKFMASSAFDQADDRYYLMPFRFHVASDGREILVNEVGDHLWAPRGTAQALAEHRIDRDHPYYLDLRAAGFLSTEPLPALVDVYATRYRTAKAFLDDFTTLHIFVLTLRCNQSCHYCQVSRQTEDKHQYDMSEEDLERALALMFCSPAPALTVEFQGGEPLLAFELVRRAVLRAKQLNAAHGKQLSFVICTNLLLVDDAVLAFCRDHQILLSTSVDGPDALHDQNRPWRESAAARVREKLAQVREVLGPDRVSALMTTTRASLAFPREIVDHYIDLGFEGVFLRPISPYGFARKSKLKNHYDTEHFLAFYLEALTHVVQYNKRGRLFREEYASILLRKILTPFPVNYVDLQSPAGMITSVIVYNYDGKVYVSDEARMLAQQGDDSFCLGHVSDGYASLFLGQKARTLLTHGVNEALAGCADCAFQSYCGADPVFHHATQGDPEGYRPSSSFCQRNLRLIEHLLTWMERDPEAATIFRRWAVR